MKVTMRYVRITTVALLLMAMFIGGLCLCSAPGQHAGAASKMITDADIQALRDQISANDKRIKEYKDRIKSLSASLENAIEEKEALDQQIDVLQTNIENTEELIRQYALLIEEKEQQIDEREETVSDEYRDFLSRLRVSYVSGAHNTLELLMGADDLADFLTRADTAGSLLRYEQELMENLDREISDLNRLKESLQEKKKEYDELRADQKAAEADLEKALKDAERVVNSIKKDASAQQRALEKAAAAENSLDVELTAMLKKQKEQQSAYVGGLFLWPLDASKTRLTDLFGTRILYGKTNVHRGIDIPAPRGTNITACNKGTVTTAAYNSSYGYYIVVDHGGGKATLYAHCSKLIAKKGDTVSRGQVIAQVGMTGSATGNHLHLEIRINGVAVDPLKAGLLVIQKGKNYVDPVKGKLLTFQSAADRKKYYGS